MNRRIFPGILAVALIAGLIVFLYTQQKILDREVAKITSASPRTVATAEPAAQVQPVKRGKIPVIDPMNDPLAPMVRVTPPEETKPALTPTGEPKKFSEYPLDSPILVQ